MSAETRPGRPPGKQGAALLAVARSTFLELGFERATMQEIARRARVSKASLYREHPSKDELFIAVVTDWTAQGRGAMRPHVEALMASSDMDEGLTTFTSVLLGAMLAPPVVAMRRLIAAEAERLPAVADLYLETSWKTNIETLASALSELERAGRLNVADPTIAAEQLVWMAVGAPLNACTLGASVTDVADDHVAATVATFLARYGSERRDP